MKPLEMSLLQDSCTVEMRARDPFGGGRVGKSKHTEVADPIEDYRLAVQHLQPLTADDDEPWDGLSPGDRLIRDRTIIHMSIGQLKVYRILRSLIFTLVTDHLGGKNHFNQPQEFGRWNWWIWHRTVARAALWVEPSCSASPLDCTFLAMIELREYCNVNNLNCKKSWLRYVFSNK